MALAFWPRQQGHTCCLLTLQNAKWPLWTYALTVLYKPQMSSLLTHQMLPTLGYSHSRLARKPIEDIKIQPGQRNATRHVQGQAGMLSFHPSMPTDRRCQIQLHRGNTVVFSNLWCRVRNRANQTFKRLQKHKYEVPALPLGR